MLDSLLEKNQEWAKRIRAENPEFFAQLSKVQNPDYLWIGCADSRVPANEIVNLPPGEVFVHRNIANVVVHSDMNCLSVVQYAVEVLKVSHIMVVGHYGCGGVAASMSQPTTGLIENWLQHIRDVYRFHQQELDAIEEDDARANRLVELNILEQVENVCKTTVVRKAWELGQPLEVHGWVYSIKDGLLKDLGFGRSASK